MRLAILLYKICILIALPFLLLFISCNQYETHSMQVTATAYNSVPWQTKKIEPNVAAWDDTLKPGMKCIAVSRDLIPLGLTHRTKVKITGLPGTYLVLDKMNKRYTKRIDLYMGTDIHAARDWGKRKVTITWRTKKNSDSLPSGRQARFVANDMTYIKLTFNPLSVSPCRGI